MEDPAGTSTWCSSKPRQSSRKPSAAGSSGNAARGLDCAWLEDIETNKVYALKQGYPRSQEGNYLLVHLWRPRRAIGLEGKMDATDIPAVQGRVTDDIDELSQDLLQTRSR